MRRSGERQLKAKENGKGDVKQEANSASSQNGNAMMSDYTTTMKDMPKKETRANGSMTKEDDESKNSEAVNTDEKKTEDGKGATKNKTNKKNDASDMMNDNDQKMKKTNGLDEDDVLDEITREQVDKYTQNLNRATINTATLISETISVKHELSSESASDTSGPPFVISVQQTIKPRAKTYVGSPFKIMNGSPGILEFRGLRNAAQTLDDNISVEGTKLSESTQVQESYRLFGPDSLKVTVNLKTSVNGIELGEFEAPQTTYLKVGSQSPGDYDYQTSATTSENRLLYLLKLFSAVTMTLYHVPSKLVFTVANGSDKIVENVSKMTLWEGDDPHPYLVSFFNIGPWLRTELNNLYELHPIQIAETSIYAPGGTKQTSKVSRIVDQWGAALANNNFLHFLATQATNDTLLASITACASPNERVSIETYLNLTQYGLAYQPTKTDWNAFFMMLFINAPLRESYMNEFARILESSERLKLLSVTDVLSLANAPTPDPTAASYYNSFVDSLRIGNVQSIYDVLMLETLAPHVDVQFTLPAFGEGYGAMLNIIHILSTFVVFPQLSFHHIHILGFHLTNCLRSAMTTLHNAWALTYSDILASDNSVTGKTGIVITADESRQGNRYSIFNPLPRAPNINADYYAAIIEINEIITPYAGSYTMTRKMNAGFPFNAPDYQAYPSWNLLSNAEGISPSETDFTRKIRRIYGLIRRLNTIRTNTLGVNYPKGFATWSTNFLNRLEEVSSSASLAFEYSMAEIQRTIQSNPIFVHQDFKGLQPYQLPPNIMLGPSSTSITGDNNHFQGIYLNRTMVHGFSLAYATRLLLTLEGDGINRSIMNKNERDPLNPANQHQLASPGNLIASDKLYHMAMSYVAEARNFGIGLQSLIWFTAPNLPNNPLELTVAPIRRFLKFSNWTALAEAIVSIFGVNLQSLFINVIMPSANIVDARIVGRKLVYVSGDGISVIPTPPGYLIGRELDIVDNLTLSQLNLLSKLLSPATTIFSNYVTDVSIYKDIVPDLYPQIPMLSSAWNLQPIDDVVFSNQPLKNGYVQAITFKDRAGTVKTEYLPYGNFDKLLIKVKSMNEILSVYKRNLAIAIHEGLIGIYATDVAMIFSLTDYVDRTPDYSPTPSALDIERLLELPAGREITVSAPSTKYATHYNLNNSVMPSYRQYVNTLGDVEKNIFSSVLSNTLTKPTNALVPSGLRLEYGKEGNQVSLYFSDGRMKINAYDTPNFNNSYYAITNAITQNIIKVKVSPINPYTGT